MIVIPSETDIALLCAYLAFLPFAVGYLIWLGWLVSRREVAP